MGKQKHKLFEKYLPLGMEFIKLWNKQDRDGAQNVLSEHFNLSVATVYRIRKKLDLERIHSPNHPGRRKLLKRIRKLYGRGSSTLRIGKLVKMNSQNVNNILRKMNVKLGPQHCTNPLHFSFHNKSISHSQMLKKIKTMYEEGMTAANIAKELKVDQGAVSIKLKTMNIDLRQLHRHIKGGYSCHWCRKVMEEVWQNKGPRKQKYCCHSCKNKAKDYRRMTKGDRVSANRLKSFNDFLKNAWGEDYDKAKIRILKAKPCVKKKAKISKITPKVIRREARYKSLQEVNVFTVSQRKRHKLILGKMVIGESYNIGDLYDTLNLGVSYKTFQRDINHLSGKGLIKKKSVIKGRGRSTLLTKSGVN